MKNTTIIIPIFNRHDHIESLIEYYKGFKVIFVDSSDTPFQYPSYVNHIRCKGMLLYEALYTVLKQIDTKYICWNNDDDLVTKDFLPEGEKFLEENPEYSNVMGRQINVYNDLSPMNGIYGVKEWNVWLEQQFFSNSIIDRIHYMNNFFHTPVHGIMLKECLLDSVLIPLTEEKFYPIRYFDRIVGIVQACYGNKKVLPVLSCLRRQEQLGRMIHQNNYPTRLKRDIPQDYLVNTLQENDNTFIQYLIKKNLTPSEIRSINFNNKI